MRTEIKLNEDWLFHKGDIENPLSKDKGFVYSQAKTERKKSGPAAYGLPDFEDAYRAMPGDMVYRMDWCKVSLPHDYIIESDNLEDENQALGYFHYENAWYRKHFSLPDGTKKDRRVLIRFEGVTGQSTVYLNGCLIGRNFSSYNTFELDISDYVWYDRENVLAVYVNVTDQFEGWWYGGGGIYRDVYLTVTDPVAIDLYGVYAPYEKINDRDFQVNFKTECVNAGFGSETVTLKSQVIAPDGTVAAEATAKGEIPARGKATVNYSAVVKAPLLWDCDNPNLYTVETTLLSSDGSTDCNTTRIGFRTVEITVEKGLLLNGKEVFINGVCCHQDFGLTGLAVPENIARYKISLLKEMGANGYRTSHYEQTAAYMDALDEMGFLVMDEMRWFENTEESRKQLSALVKRDRNRPSVILWSTGNEEPYFLSDAGRRIHRSLSAEIEKLDDTRFITAAEDRKPQFSTIYEDCDVIGINYNLNLYDEVHKAYPKKPVFSSECCATGTTRDWNFPDFADGGRLRDYDKDASEWFLGREKTYRFLRSTPYVFGCYQWIGVEHRGEAAWPRVCSASGAIDLYLQKKGVFYQNLSHWSKEPMAHLVPHWNFEGLEGQTLPVTVYTNCDQLELFLNGVSLGKKQIEKYGRGEWQVTYQPGTLKVVGYRNGKAVAEDERVTTGKPQKLRFTKTAPFCFNGEDLALFTLEAVDENGRAVPNAAEFVRFSVSAPAKIVGTGSDNTDHVRVSCPNRQMYMGKIAVCVKPQKDTAFTLTAESANCGYASITLRPDDEN